MSESDEKIWSGGERRHGGRAVYSRGPIIRTLEALSAITGLAAIVALVISLIVFGDRLSLIQQSRERSATDTCYLFRAVVLKASTHNPNLGESFLTSVGLDNCSWYGASVTRLDK